jgi:hypothetical protein
LKKFNIAKKSVVSPLLRLPKKPRNNPGYGGLRGIAGFGPYTRRPHSKKVEIGNIEFDPEFGFKSIKLF